MSYFYQRTESEKEITIIYTRLAIHRYAMVVMIFFLFPISVFQQVISTFSLTFKSVLLITILVIVLVGFPLLQLAFLRPYRDIKYARKQGRAVSYVSGNSWSFKDPLTIRIEKE